jgi:hypothetical protein
VRIYKWLTEEEVYFGLKVHYGTPYTLFAKGKKELVMYHASGNMYINPAFAWDGCSPTIVVFDSGTKLGIWDGDMDGITKKQKLYYPTLKHDILCQLLAKYKDKFCYTQKEIDEEFKKDMKAVKFIFTVPYYLAVRLYQTVKGWFK